MARENRRQDRITFDTQQQGVQLGPLRPQMGSRARPARHHGGQHVECAGRGAAEVSTAGRKLVGKDLPQAVQPGARAQAKLFVVGGLAVLAPALGVVDDADRRVAVGGDVDKAAQGLAPCRGVRRQQTRSRVLQSEMDQDPGSTWAAV